MIEEAPVTYSARFINNITRHPLTQNTALYCSASFAASRNFSQHPREARNG
jgi:hypothetical protein